MGKQIVQSEVLSVKCCRYPLILLLVLAGMQSLFARFRIEQTARWWRYASLRALVQWVVIAMLGGKTL